MPDLTPWMIWAATYFMHSSLLLSAVWLWFRYAEPRSHALRENVWKLAAVGGLITASLQLGLGIESPLNRVVDSAWNSPLNSQVAPADADLTGAMQLASHDGDARLLDMDMAGLPKPATLLDEASEPVLLESADLDSAVAGTQLIRDDVPTQAVVSQPAASIRAVSASDTNNAWARFLQKCLTGVFGASCGAIVALSGWGLVRLLTEQAEFRQRLKTCRTDSDGPARRALDELLSAVGIRRSVRLMLDNQDLEPGACGWFQWQIVLPARAVEVLTPEELRGLLAHELAHLVRGDQWWLLVGRLLAVCFGWQPLNRIALREWQRASEYLCDAWAIQRQVPRLSLARCLTTVAEWRLVGLATVAGMGSGNMSNLSQRVERLVEDVPLTDPWQRYGRRHLLAAVGCLVAVGMVSLAPAATFPSRPQSAPKQTLAASADVGPTSAPSTPDSDDMAQHEQEKTTLLATRREAAPQSVVITVQTVEVVRQQASIDLIELQAELKNLQYSISQSPQYGNHPLWRAQMQRFRQRMEKLQRLQNVLIVPL